MLNITQQDAIWLAEDYNRIRGYGKVNSWIDWHVRALTLLKGSWTKPDCNCQYGVTARIANDMYSQYESEIKAIAYPPQTEVIENVDQSASKTVTRGRKKKTEE